jgi:hypothetical protein
MSTVNHLRNEIIDKLLTISNKNYLTALYQLVENSTTKEDIIQLSEEQLMMLKLSDKDIQLGKVISHNQLDKDDLKWLKEQ